MIYPECPYCWKPLTDNERDSETGSFSSAHTRCTMEDSKGLYEVASFAQLAGEGPFYPAHQGVRRFNNLARALEELDRLASVNRPSWKFVLTDGWTAETVEVYGYLV